MSTSIAIIGAGMAGTTLAQRLQAGNYQITLFEKSRGTGGRMASCRLSASSGHPHSADLGAPAFTVQHPRFSRWVEQQTGIQRWQPLHHSFSGATLPTPTLWTGVPRQSAITRALGSQCELRSDTRVGQLQTDTTGHQWQLRDIHGALLGSYDQVVVATPAPQAAQLLAVRPSLGALPGTLRPAPAWVSVIVLPGRAGLHADLYSGAHPLLERAVCDSAKPGRETTDGASVWQLQARRDWSEAHLDSDPDWVGQQLLQALTELAGHPPLTPLAQRTHRWLYCQHPHTVPQPFLWEPASPAGPALGACGDWLLQSDIEGAWLSAQALADQLLAG